MVFKKLLPLPLVNCAICHSTGIIKWGKCGNCKGKGVGFGVRGIWLYWGYPLEKYFIALAKAKRTFNKVRFVTAIIIGLNFFIWAAVIFYQAGAYNYFAGSISNLNFEALLLGESATLAWLGVVSFCYVWYRVIKQRVVVSTVEKHEYNESNEAGEPPPDAWPIINKISKKNKKNISECFTGEALDALSDAYNLADRQKISTVGPLQLFYSLLRFNRISNIFIRLGIPLSVLNQALFTLEQSINSKAQKFNSAPTISPDVWQIIFKSYEEAYNIHQEYVSVTELLVATAKESAEIQELLFNLGAQKQKLVNAVEWARIKERLYRQYQKFRKAARRRSTTGMDRAMTALATPYLNNFSDDLTLMAQFGHTDPCIAREKEIEEIFRIIEGGGQSVILVGDYGVGKRSVVEGVAERMVEDDVPARLNDKRMVRLSVPTLLAGTTPSGAVERLIRIMNEIARARNIILFIHNIHELVGVSAGGQDSLDVAGTLAEYLSSGRFLTFATTTTQAYAQYINNSKLGTVMAKVDIAEMDENQAIQVLESKVGYAEYKHKVFFSYDALEKAVQFCKRYLHEIYLPGSALEVMSEAASYARSKKGLNSLVTGEEVAAIIAEKTKIPVTAVSANETEKLLRLEQEMHKRVVGQDEAVNLVANALRRSRAEMRSKARPIANFLFLGPTGVGKTELAKTIAEDYFGGEERMTRLDMSEYQDKASIYRLIGTTGDKGSGILTETIKRNPFTLLLLDEIEKADKDILNLFLQVMDDGRLTDSTGRVVDFTNVILIATSNAGTSYVQEQLNAGVPTDKIKDSLMHGELNQYFRPEFLNRFDGIILFKPLGQEDIKKVAAMMLKRTTKDLEAKGITLQVLPEALDFLAKAGFDPAFGARPMRRALQERVEDKLAVLLLQGKLKRNNVVVIGKNGEITVQ